MIDLAWDRMMWMLYALLISEHTVACEYMTLRNTYYTGH
jgi:hypothetical protein